jgi:hypothetical protein
MFLIVKIQPPFLMLCCFDLILELNLVKHLKMMSVPFPVSVHHTARYKLPQLHTKALLLIKEPGYL